MSILIHTVMFIPILLKWPDAYIDGNAHLHLKTRVNACVVARSIRLLLDQAIQWYLS